MTPRNSAKTAKKNPFASSAYIFAFFAVNVIFQGSSLCTFQVHIQPKTSLRKYIYKLLTSIWLYLPSFISFSAGWNSQVRFIGLLCLQRQQGRFIRK